MEDEGRLNCKMAAFHSAGQSIYHHILEGLLVKGSQIGLIALSIIDRA
jgi:hypothetical protein